ncbi:tripartite tricarboxylate transporter substrate binding protein [Vineibacter terrae]|uniref:Bug family tripartite tricarboxylate transporter substrate binding protein n=1 Tax=Vineibacter terrae TaxID=2586908 RepID=UPI002E3794F3|nr:tripartite tricarboxylate transporter substrate binding protein [Vineibacter terrae]HEX2885879.1 tripartite tricarboxylate transporter substrate binding protein [Vineibacter terrae]
MPFHRRSFLAGLSLMAAAPTARAQSWPAKPIRLVVPYPAGGSTDVLARVIAERLTATLGQQVIVDNKPGASGNLGSDLVAKAPADGYTLVMGNNATHATNQSLFPNHPYDAAKDFAPIALVAGVTHVLVVHPDVPATDIRAFVAWAKAQGGKVNYASTGNGSASHLTMELFKGLAKIDLTHVPYKGTAPAVQDLVSGQVSTSFQTMPSVIGQIRAGKLRALATTGKARAPALPDVPTVAETLFPGFESDAWFALFAPAGTSADIVTRLNGDILKAMALPEVKDVAAKAGFEVVTSSPAELGTFVRAEIEKWAKVVKASGATVD